MPSFAEYAAVILVGGLVLGAGAGVAGVLVLFAVHRGARTPGWYLRRFFQIAGVPFGLALLTMAALGALVSL